MVESENGDRARVVTGAAKQRLICIRYGNYIIKYGFIIFIYLTNLTTDK